MKVSDEEITGKRKLWKNQWRNGWGQRKYPHL
jgi:hypothetical protein